MCPEFDNLNRYAADFGSEFFSLLFYVAQWNEDRQDNYIMKNSGVDIDDEFKEEIDREKVCAEFRLDFCC